MAFILRKTEKSIAENKTDVIFPFVKKPASAGFFIIENQPGRCYLLSADQTPLPRSALNCA